MPIDELNSFSVEQLKGMPQHTLIEIIQKMKEGSSLNDITLPWMYGLAELLHTLDCKNSHDPEGCQFSTENSLSDPWTGEDHQHWLANVKRICKEYEIYEVTQHNQSLICLAAKLRSELIMTELNIKRLILNKILE